MCMNEREKKNERLAEIKKNGARESVCVCYSRESFLYMRGSEILDIKAFVCKGDEL